MALYVNGDKVYPGSYISRFKYAVEGSSFDPDFSPTKAMTTNLPQCLVLTTFHG